MALEDFFSKFFDCTKVPPSICLLFCDRMDAQRVHNCTFFGTVTLFENLNFLGNSSLSPEGPASLVLILCNSKMLKISNGPTFTIFGTMRLFKFLIFFLNLEFLK